MELPPGALIAGALGRHGGELRGRTEDDEVSVLVAGESGANDCIDHARLKLSRETAAVRSLEVGILHNQHRCIGIADYVAGEGQALSMSEVNHACGSIGGGVNLRGALSLRLLSDS